MNYKHFFLVVLVVAVSDSILSAQTTIGSGRFVGTFEHAEPVQESGDYLVPTRSSELRSQLLSPTARVVGRSNYVWGLQNFTDDFYLDGVITPVEEINALANSEGDEFDNDRVTTLFSPSENQLRFDAANFVNQSKGQTLVAGTLFYRNGVSRTGTDVASVLFGIESESESLDFQNLLDLTIGIETTRNIFDDSGNMLQEESADFIYFKERPELGSFRVFEGEATSVEILVEFNSLHLIGFGAVAEPLVGFVSSSVAVPEPTSGVFLLLGLSAAACRRSRRRVNQ